MALMKTYYESPIGGLTLTASANSLQSITFGDDQSEANSTSSNEILDIAIKQLSEYFEGQRTSFSLPLSPEGSDFQQSIWEQLQDVPYGQTITYGALADKLGDPNKVRAVGSANGQNPIPIIIPCHRVIGANNNLVGYSGGIERKEFLLKHEGALLL
ncbi:methylated-DNA--[protein]-cysteine S-methyltransferase [Fodinibius sp. Rm-B-1B1-1]|uniref:methylated-DNA--[protein]-cysteine S-methyltransferase n=1 Tax=Fodinibius alkaliphilus TaxID=3140241 RepID=UPI00315ABD85